MTGMSGAGKSTALDELAKRGFQVVETDDAPWSEWSEAAGGYVWREDLISDLLSRDDGAGLYVSGTVSNQGRFYSQFDAVVLLSAPVDSQLVAQALRRGHDHAAELDDRDAADVDGAASCEQEQTQSLLPLARAR